MVSAHTTRLSSCKISHGKPVRNYLLSIVNNHFTKICVEAFISFVHLTNRFFNRHLSNNRRGPKTESASKKSSSHQ